MCNNRISCDAYQKKTPHHLRMHGWSKPWEVEDYGPIFKAVWNNLSLVFHVMVNPRPSYAKLIATKICRWVCKRQKDTHPMIEIHMGNIITMKTTTLGQAGDTREVFTWCLEAMGIWREWKQDQIKYCQDRAISHETSGQFNKVESKEGGLDGDMRALLPRQKGITHLKIPDNIWKQVRQTPL